VGALAVALDQDAEGVVVPRAGALDGLEVRGTFVH
jgi:hypothetical protein